MKSLRIATRKSQLALWQARHVQALLAERHPDLKVELVPMSTEGDERLDRSLADIGGKGLFVKALEELMLSGGADIAVHSMKDVPQSFPEGLALSVMLERADPRDVIVSNSGKGIKDLPQGCKIGTSSLRRQSQIRAIRPDAKLEMLRGNVDTRLKKLDEGEYDAIVLAAAGLQRLGWASRISAYCEVEEILPSVGQGAIGIECRTDDKKTKALLKALSHADTETRVTAERAVAKALGGSCTLPLAAYAELQSNRLRLRALVACPESGKILYAEHQGRANEPVALGQSVAELLKQQGAEAIIQRYL